MEFSCETTGSITEVTKGLKFASKFRTWTTADLSDPTKTRVLACRQPHYYKSDTFECLENTIADCTEY